MTPKEKAEDLILKYLRIENTNEWWSKVPAKQCALIAVEEIIQAIDWHEFDTPNNEFNYWNKVKKEIEKL